MEPFDEPAAQAVYRGYKESGAIAEMDRLLRLLLPVAETVVCKKLGYISGEFDEIRSYVLLRLCRGLTRRYDPVRGSLFNFTTKLTENCLIDQLRRKASRDKYFIALDDVMLARFCANGATHKYVVCDLVYRVMQVRTVFCDRHELEAQRWLVRNLVVSDFCFHRWQAANSMTIVYDIPPERARQLYDITLLSVRRMLIGERKLKPVSASDLRATRAKALVRYRAQLSEAEFARLVYLMRNLAPSLIESNGFTLQSVLYGPPDERALFSHSEALAAASEAVGPCRASSERVTV
jgi:hypothetical protein